MNGSIGTGFVFNFKIIDNFLVWMLNERSKKGLFGCIGAVLLCGAGVAIVKKIKSDMLLKKLLFIETSSQNVFHSKLQTLNSEDHTERDEILDLSAKELIKAAQEGKFLPKSILHAYTYQACLTTKTLNCVTGMVNDAELQARRLIDFDPGLLQLYALPVSVKESVEIKGMDATAGLLQNVDDPSPHDAVIVKVLKHCGAIPFVKTNLSQMMFSFESSNPIFGKTRHPLNTEFGPGGSSSGEGALIGAGGCLLGFGSDTGGSIRCPAHLCGIVGFVPTKNRISSKGLRVLPGQIGPMAKNVDTVVMAMNAVLCPLMFKLDYNVPPIPFNMELFECQSRLRIGFYYDDNYLKPVPAVKRAVNMAKNFLSEAGHELIPFYVPRIEEAIKMFTQRAMGFACKNSLKALDGEPVDPVLKGIVRKWSMASFRRRITSFLVGLKSPRIGRDLQAHEGNLQVADIQKLEVQIEKYQQEFSNLWQQDGLDALICPPFPVVAGPLGSLNNLSAGVVPITKVNAEDQQFLEHYVGHYDDHWDQQIKQTCKNSLGMPVGVQCVAQPFQDEVCLRVMKELETVADFEGQLS